MHVETNASTPADSTVPTEASNLEIPILRYTSDSYQKILDYHVAEILLTTIILAVVLLLRLHR